MRITSYVGLGLLSVFLFACGGGPVASDSTDPTNVTPDALGWTGKAVSDLKKECMERFQPSSNVEQSKEEYCDCFIDKITISVTLDQHNSSNEKTVNLYDEFSEICNSLTSLSKERI